MKNLKTLIKSNTWIFNLEEHGSLFIALFFECTRNICQIFLDFEENIVTFTLDFDKNRDYVLVNYRD